MVSIGIGSGIKLLRVATLDAQIHLPPAEEFPCFRESSIEVVSDGPANIFAIHEGIVDFTPVGTL